MNYQFSYILHNQKKYLIFYSLKLKLNPNPLTPTKYNLFASIVYENNNEPFLLISLQDSRITYFRLKIIRYILTVIGEYVDFDHYMGDYGGNICEFKFKITNNELLLQLL